MVDRILRRQRKRGPRRRRRNPLRAERHAPAPENLWDDRTDGTPFWHLAYHALFYTDFYLSDDAASFQAQGFHVEKANFPPGDYNQPLGVIATPEQPVTKAQLLAYADHCLQESDDTFDRLTAQRVLERCGFPWYQLNVGEFLLNTLRHTQHHAGQLALLLRLRADRGVQWLGTKSNPSRPTRTAQD